MEIKFNAFREGAKAPCRMTDGAAGYDLYSVEDAKLEPGNRLTVSTGLIVEIPHGYHMEIIPRSGIASEFGVTVLNSPGTIDSDFRGEVGVMLYNTSQLPFYVKKGDRIAQAVIIRQCDADWIPCKYSELSESLRGGGGFGSTGMQGVKHEDRHDGKESKCKWNNFKDVKPNDCEWCLIRVKSETPKYEMQLGAKYHVYEEYCFATFYLDDNYYGDYFQRDNDLECRLNILMDESDEDGILEVLWIDGNEAIKILEDAQ